MKLTVWAALAVGALAATPGDGRAGEGSPGVLVELYTSQGCNYCPPADKLLGELSARRNVVGLSLNVDYWDYIGWKDTLARPEHKQRQHAYAYEHGERSVATPHIIVNGMKAMAGGARRQVVASVQAEIVKPAPVAISLSGDGRRVAVALTGPARQAAVIAAPYRSSVAQKIDAGENRGETITYHNSVMELRRLGDFAGGEAQFELDLPELADGVAVWVQESVKAGPVGEVLGAAKLEL